MPPARNTSISKYYGKDRLPPVKPVINQSVERNLILIVLLVLTVLIVCLSIDWLYLLLRVYVVASRLIWR